MQVRLYLLVALLCVWLHTAWCVGPAHATSVSGERQLKATERVVELTLEGGRVTCPRSVPADWPTRSAPVIAATAGLGAAPLVTSPTVVLILLPLLTLPVWLDTSSFLPASRLGQRFAATSLFAQHTYLRI